MVKVSLKKQLGKKVTESRKARGLSQEKLADALKLKVRDLFDFKKITTMKYIKI